MTTATIEMTKLDQVKAEKQRVSVLCRKLAKKLGTIDPFSEQYLETYANYTFLQDYRSELVTQIQLTIREERYGY